MYLAIAVETKNHPRAQFDYRIWYLEIDQRGQVIGVGVKSKDELIAHIFECMKKYGRSLWRAFLKDQESSTPIEIYDFVSINMFENTHFGNLPNLSEFQKVLDTLESRIELRSIA